MNSGVGALSLNIELTLIVEEFLGESSVWWLAYVRPVYTIYIPFVLSVSAGRMYLFLDLDSMKAKTIEITKSQLPITK